MNETNTTALPIHITSHHLRLSPAVLNFLREKFAKIPRFASDVLATEVVLRREDGVWDRFSASARLALSGHDIHATATDGNLYSAIVKLVSRLARRSRKRKTRFEKSRRGRGPSLGMLLVSRDRRETSKTSELSYEHARSPHS